MYHTGNSIRCALIRMFVVALSFAFFFPCALALSSTNEIILGPWHLRHPTPTGYGRGLAHDGQKYVLADGYGGIYTSISGWNWTRQSSPAVPFLSSIAHGLNTFVAVGVRGAILSSTNGTNWIQLSSPVTNNLDKIIFAHDRFFIVGHGGTILASPDGLHFTTQSSGVTNWLRDITAGPGALVAVGEENTILVSTNSLHWIKASVTNTISGSTNHYFSGVAHFKGNYHVGPLISANPFSWTNNLSSHPANFVGDLAATDRVIAQRGPNQQFRLSYDGRSWFSHEIVTNGNFNLIVISNLLHVLGGGGLYFGDRNNQFTRLHHGVLGHASLSATRFTNLLADHNGFFARASDKTYFSRDGKAWRIRTLADPPLPTNELAFASAPFARYSSGRFEFSENGADWTPLPSPPIRSAPLNRLRKAVAVGDTVIAVDSFNLWVLTNQSNPSWTRLMTNSGPELLEGGTDEYLSNPYPWITTLEVGADIVAATTTWGELLLSRDGRTWQTNQTVFASSFVHSTITPRGIMIAEFQTIAEALFDAAPDIPTQFGFTVKNAGVQFNGAMAHFEIQTRPSLATPWETFVTTSANQFIPIPSTGTAFFRAIMPP